MSYFDLIILSDVPDAMANINIAHFTNIALEYMDTYHGKVSNEIMSKVKDIILKTYGISNNNDRNKLIEEFKLIVKLSDIDLNKLVIKAQYRNACFVHDQISNVIEQNPGIKDCNDIERLKRMIDLSRITTESMIQDIDSINNMIGIHIIFKQWLNYAKKVNETYELVMGK
jgi:hypothetical protein